MIGVVCGQCGIRLRVGDHLAGRRVRCRRCGGVTSIPRVAPEAAPTTSSPATVPENVFRPTRPARKRKPLLPNLEPWLSLMLGVCIVVVARLIPVIGRVPAVLQIVVHELGHVGTDWLTGGASVPGFDLANGGGFARGLGQLTGLLVIIYAVFAYVIFRVRMRPWLLILCLIAVSLHALVTFTRLRDFLVVTMGHGLGLIVAGIFLYRSLSGAQILRAAERPFYAFLGIYFLVGDFQFAYVLRNDPEKREDYEGETRDGIHHDLVRAANEYLHVPLETVATWYLAFCLLTPLVALLAFWLRSRLESTRPDS